MDKKVFVPCSVFFIIIDVILFSFSGIFVYLIISSLVEDSIDKYFISSILAFAFLFGSAFRFLFALAIHIRKDDVITYGDGLPKFEKIQYRTSIKYIDIQSIEVVFSKENSLNQSLASRSSQSYSLKKYLEFGLINGDKKRICILYYTRRQVNKIVKNICDNMQLCGNPNVLNADEIMKKWCKLINYKEEKSKQ